MQNKEKAASQPRKTTARGQRAPKGVLRRLLRTLFEFYPVLLPVTLVCILINAIVSATPAMRLFFMFMDFSLISWIDTRTVSTLLEAAGPYHHPTGLRSTERTVLRLTTPLSAAVASTLFATL